MHWPTVMELDSSDAFPLHRAGGGGSTDWTPGLIPHHDFIVPG